MTSFYPIDETHAPELQSWVESANDPQTDFPIQNLPFGRFRRTGGEEWRIGVSIGDHVLDLKAAGLVDHDDMNRPMATRAAERRALRKALSTGLRAASAREGTWRGALCPQSELGPRVPCPSGCSTAWS